MFANIFSKILKHKTLFFVIAIVLGFFLSGFDMVAFAQGNSADSQNFMKQEDLNKIVSFLNTLLSFVSVLLAIFTYLSTMFLSPEWINGSLFGIDSHLKLIWILVSNVVYFVFAFILIFIAFMNIIGAGKDKYQLKQSLPKFVVGVLIVPASWFIANFILSLSAILTIASLNLPFDTFKSYETKLSEVKLPKECTINLKSGGGSNDKATGNSGGKWYECQGTTELNVLLQSDKSADGIFAMIGLYTYGVVGLESSDKIQGSYIKEVRTITDLVAKIVFDFLFVFLYAILMVALGLVLMIRGIYIWIYLMMCPIFGLMFFFGKGGGGGDGFFQKFNIKEFVSLAMVPVYAMLALSFGMLFLYIVGNGMTESSFSGQVKIEKKGQDEDVLKINDFTLTIKGALGDGKTLTDYIGTVGNETLGVIGSLILKVFGLVVLWGAVMAALRASKITQEIVQPLHSFGTKVGQIATQAPQYLPIMPGGQSMQSMNRISQQAEGVFQQSANSAANDFTSKIPWFNSDDFTQAMQKIVTDAKTITDPSKVHSLYNDIIRNAKGDPNRIIEGVRSVTEALRNNSSMKGHMQDFDSDINNMDDVARFMTKFNNKNIFGNILNKEQPVSKGAILDYSNGKTSSNDDTSGSNNKTSTGTQDVVFDKTVNIINQYQNISPEKLVEELKKTVTTPFDDEDINSVIKGLKEKNWNDSQINTVKTALKSQNN